MRVRASDGRPGDAPERRRRRIDAGRTIPGWTGPLIAILAVGFSVPISVGMFGDGRAWWWLGAGILGVALVSGIGAAAQAGFEALERVGLRIPSRGGARDGDGLSIAALGWGLLAATAVSLLFDVSGAIADLLGEHVPVVVLLLGTPMFLVFVLEVIGLVHTALALAGWLRRRRRAARR